MAYVWLLIIDMLIDFTQPDAYVLPDLSSVFQRVGRSCLISVADCKSGYYQLAMKEEDKWLTAFFCL